MVAGLLFLALAYLAVGQAGAARNEAQTAADAAALAAALEVRDQLAGEWLDSLKDPDAWQDIFDGHVQVADGCWRAQQLAAQNDAQVVGCERTGPLDYRVDVEADEPVGDSIVPGTESTYAKASAKAVIEPRCDVAPPAEGAGDIELPSLSCGAVDWDLSPDDDPAELPDPEDLFDVHLAD
ncbi:pilus assembly protein TadG-related protein [Streptomyces sp. JB150]|uniref:pilus assembly protein TadG-related protein n=1 Tax=Streptomyces sp. JB150 TaxID=2714844 RepID=UPI001F101A06